MTEEGIEKISKACEPCRKRKVRCDGKEPCHRCHRRPSECVYRQRARVRKSAHRGGSSGATDVGSASQSRPSLGRSLASEGDKPKAQAEPARSQLYHSVAATHGNDPDSTDSSRLFYGPSSQFAFLQQLHREILSSTSPNQAGDREIQEGGPGLDLFVQRTIFFGTPTRSDATTTAANTPLESALSLEKALEFLSQFKGVFCHVLPLFTAPELDELIPRLYNHGAGAPLSQQKKAIALAVLANGALLTPCTDLAEMLFMKAVQEAMFTHDLVSLSTVQFHILIAEYQTNMGRPNAAYLNLGTACRKAFAMGLHKECDTTLVTPDVLQKRRSTLWCLYFHERFQALALGRDSAMKMSDISASFPDDLPILVGLCRLAQIAEEGARMIYGRRYDSLGQLYSASEKIYGQLREFSEQFGIGAAGLGRRQKFSEGVALLQLHNVFYHAILLTFRPFLIAESALRQSGTYHEPEAMWLRQACRYATDAAQDIIVYMSSSYRKTEICKTMRYNAFFLDASCVVLLYDLLQHPAKHMYSVEYINIALRCLGSMTQDEPVTIALRSIKQILRVVEDTISKKGLGVVAHSSSMAPASAAELVPTLTPSHLTYQNIQFPSLNGAPSQSAQQFIHLSDLPVTGAQGPPLNSTSLGSQVHYGGAAEPFPHFQNDVVTTDLFSFFPVDLMSPYNTSTLESDGNHNT